MNATSFQLVPADELAEIKSSIAELRDAVQRLPKPRPSIRSDYLTQDEVEQIIDVSRSTLHRLRKDGAIPFVQHGRKILFRREDIDAYLEAHLQAA